MGLFSLYKQFVFFSARQCFFHPQFCSCQSHSVQCSCLCRTDCHTSHAGDTFFCIGLIGMVRRNCPSRTAACTDSTFLTALICTGFHGQIAVITIRSVAGEGHYPTTLCLFFQFSRPFLELCCICCIQSICRKFTENRMFRNHCYTVNRRKT